MVKKLAQNYTVLLAATFLLVRKRPVKAQGRSLRFSTVNFSDSALESLSKLRTSEAFTVTETYSSKHWVKGLKCFAAERCGHGARKPTAKLLRITVCDSYMKPPWVHHSEQEDATQRNAELYTVKPYTETVQSMAVCLLSPYKRGNQPFRSTLCPFDF